jgi:hypothetical protein
MMFLIWMALGFGKELTPEEVAEKVRIQEEMSLLAQQDSWSGVESLYQKLIALEKSGAELRLDDHILGAGAAASTGNLVSMLDRINSGLEIEDDQSARNWYETTMSSTARVSIRLEVSGTVTIQSEQMFFSQEQNSSIQYVQSHLNKSGVFNGRLPVGTYTLIVDDIQKVFTVLANESNDINIEKVDSSSWKVLRSGMMVGSNIQYIWNPNLSLAPRSHGSGGGVISYSRLYQYSKLGVGMNGGLLGGGGFGSGHVKAFTDVSIGMSFEKGMTFLGPQIGGGWTRVVGVTKEHAETICSNGCSNLELIVDESISSTYYVSTGLAFGYHHLPKEGRHWSLKNGLSFDGNVWALGSQFSVLLGQSK